MELAELALYEDTLCTMKIPLHRMNDVMPVYDMDNITDGNIITYFLATDKEKSSSVIYQLERESSIGKIGFAPRNDDNYVWPGGLLRSCFTKTESMAGSPWELK